MEKEVIVNGYASRDKNGCLFISGTKGFKNDTKGQWVLNDDFLPIRSDGFPQIKWEDENPTEVEITVKLKEVPKKLTDSKTDS